MTTSTTKVPDAKVKLRPLASGRDWIVTVPGGRKLHISRRDDERAPFHVCENGWSGRGWDSLEYAVRDAVKAAKLDLPALPFTPEALRELAKQADSDPREATKIFRTLLKARTGRDWSATIGRGTAYSWTRIQAPKRRMVDYSMSLEESRYARRGRSALCGAGLSYRICRGARARCQAGHLRVGERGEEAARHGTTRVRA